MTRRPYGGDTGANPRWGIAAAVALLVAAVVAIGPTPPARAATTTTLTGTFQLAAGSCTGGTASGTYLRMILPSGGQSGPFMSNSDSTCSDQTYTPLRPGTDGGLITGSYQPQPSPPFDANGGARAGSVTAPSPFYGTAFATSTNRVDPQTRQSVSAPTVTVSGSTLHADLRAFGVTWNNQYFNQGAPKPDGSLPGNTRAANGTYDTSTGAFTLSWSSQVAGGPFDKFTGQWHLAGRFVAAASTGGSGGTSGGGSGSVSSGAVVPTGGSSTSSAPTTHATSRATTAPVAVPSGSAPATTAQQLVASTTTVTRDRWHASWWLVVLAVLIALVGFTALFAQTRVARRSRSGDA